MLSFQTTLESFIGDFPRQLRDTLKYTRSEVCICGNLPDKLPGSQALTFLLRRRTVGLHTSQNHFPLPKQVLKVARYLRAHMDRHNWFVYRPVLSSTCRCLGEHVMEKRSRYFCLKQKNKQAKPIARCWANGNVFWLSCLCMCICIYTYMCICIHMCVYICIYTESEHIYVLIWWI